jgi:hypothetical protein
MDRNHRVGGRKQTRTKKKERRGKKTTGSEGAEELPSGRGRETLVLGRATTRQDPRRSKRETHQPREREKREIARTRERETR